MLNFDELSKGNTLRPNGREQPQKTTILFNKKNVRNRSTKNKRGIQQQQRMAAGMCDTSGVPCTQ